MRTAANKPIETVAAMNYVTTTGTIAMVSLSVKTIRGCMAAAAILSVAWGLLACGSDGEAILPVATFSLHGEVLPAAYSALDSDVNDPNAAYRSNDTVDQAQAIFNPVILAGYVNLPGQGPPGRSFVSGDPVDVYRVNLLADDVIALVIGQPGRADLDLYLYHAEDTAQPVDAAVGTGANEILEAPQDGEFLIVVRFHNRTQTSGGATVYNLIVGDDSGIFDKVGLRLSDDFAPGQIVVRYADPPVGSARSLADAEQAPVFEMTPMGGTADREMLLTFDAGPQARSVMTALGLTPPADGKALAKGLSPVLEHKLETLAVIKSLQQQAGVQSAAPNFIRRPFRRPDDLYFDLQWHYTLIRLPAAWEVSTGVDEVVVAVVDTGVLLNHPDLERRLTTDGYDFISDAALEGNEPVSERGGIDPNPDDPGDLAPGGSSFHGTHVAGTIAAQTDNTVGVAGAAWDAARVMPIRAIGVGGGTSYDIIQAVRYAAGLPNDSGTLPDRAADIVNLSLGGNGYSEPEAALYRTISATGTIVVAAAGNQGQETKSYPAAYDGVISVSAIDSSSTLAYYSNFGDTIDVAAPGGDNSVDLNSDGYPDGVLSTAGNDTSGQIVMSYRLNQGTSMAAPHVAGVAALMKSLWPEMDATAFTGLLLSGTITTDLGTPGWDRYYGIGLINAQKAVFAARDETVPTLLNANPSAIGFGALQSSAALVLDKLGDPAAPLVVLAVGSDADWLQVAPERIDDDGLGTYTITVDRSGLADGFYSGTVTFRSTANEIRVAISMQIGQADRTADAGPHYMLLVDPLTMNSLAQVEATLDEGVYRFSFDHVVAGEYLLYTGSDLDNNLVIGDASESLGAYLSIDQPSVIRVDRDMANLKFRTGFNLMLSGSGHLPPADMDRSTASLPKRISR